MNDMEKLGIVIKYEFLKHIRRKRLYIIMAVALLTEALVLILIPALQGGYPKSVMVMAGLLSVGSSLAAIGAVFFAGDAIAGEYESKTGFLLFTNPIKRELLWIGKYLAGFIAVTILMVFTYIIMAVALLVIYQQVPVEIFESFGLALFFAAAVLSTTFFFSAVSKGSMGATIMTLLFVWMFCGILESVLAFTGNPYWYVLSAGGDSIALPFGSLESFMAGFGGMGGMGDAFGSMFEDFKPLTTGMAAWGMAIYFVAGFVASIWISRRRQLA